MRDFVTAQRSTNEFVKTHFFNLKTKVEQGQKKYQASIQDLEQKFGRLSDQFSSRPPGTLPSNTQTNPKPSGFNDKTYRPPQTRNEHINAVFTRSGLSYDPPPIPTDNNLIQEEEDEAEEEAVEEEPTQKTNRSTNKALYTENTISTSPKKREKRGAK